MNVCEIENQLNVLLAESLKKACNFSEENLKSPLISPLQKGGKGGLALLEFPKDKTFGDISSSIPLKLASVLRLPPADIAQKIITCLKAEISGSKIGTFIEDINVKGKGFINFIFTSDFFRVLLKEILNEKSSYWHRKKIDKKLLIEFVSANPTGPLSVAHGRQAAVGDALANILEFLGYDVKREYYLNDEGNQINILGNSINLRLRELKGEKVEFPEDHYQGAYIYDLAKELLEKPANTYHTLEHCRDHGVKRILEIIRKELTDFGVKFDYWYSQKELTPSGKITQAIESLKKKGFIYEQDGAVWFKSTEFGDDKDRVIIKSDGSYTYLAPDIAYHQDKFKRGFDWLINLWGPDHHGYINRLKASVEASGHKKEQLDVIIVQLATLFKEGKVISMSTRKGEYVTLREVLDEVGRDAARLFFLTRKTDSHLDFDLELAKKQAPENPVYYIQYAHARVSNILANANLPIAEILKADFSLFKEKSEFDLLRVLSGFEYALKIAETQLDPYALTSFLQESAEAFHRFYDTTRVLVEDEELKKSRLCLVLGCKIIIARGLHLLGVSAPEKM